MINGRVRLEHISLQSLTTTLVPGPMTQLSQDLVQTLPI